MVDEIRDVPKISVALQQTERADGDTPSKDEGVRKLIEGFRGAQDSDADEDAFMEVGKQVQNLRALKPGTWTRGMVNALAAAIAKVIEQKSQKAQAMDLRDDYAVEAGANAARMQLRKLISSLNVPSEIAELDDFQELLEMLWPPSQRRKGSKFNKGSSLKGTVKSEVMQKLVEDAVQQASRRAGKKMLQQQQMQSKGEGLNQFAKMSLDQMARRIKKMMRKKAKGKEISEDGVERVAAVDAQGDGDAADAAEDRQLQEMMELLCQKALETMRIVREEIAPKWAPEQQPWLLQEADKHVFNILLATADQDMLEQTQSWDNIQDLRAGQAVFTLRAADKLTEAARRK